jgi:hypothetical protein
VRGYRRFVKMSGAEFGDMYPLLEAWKWCIGVSNDMTDCDRVDKEGVYFDAPDATMHYPFLPIFRHIDTHVGMQTHHVMPLLGVRCELLELVGILSACGSTGKFGFGLLLLCPRVSVHTTVVAQCNTLPPSLYNRTAKYKVSKPWEH